MNPDHIAGDNNPIDIDFDLWDRTFAVNTRGYLAGCKYAIPHMLEAGGGSIVNTASGSAILGDLGAIAYGSSKGAVVTMTKYIATIYGKRNIRCNAINPGLIRTEGGKRNVFGPMVDIQLRNTLTPRLGESEDIANLVCVPAVGRGRLCHRIDHRHRRRDVVPHAVHD